MIVVYLTGIDGCGKTTQAKMLTDYLNSMGIKSQYQWLRWSPSIGKLISAMKSKPADQSSNLKNNNISFSTHNDSCLQANENLHHNKWSSIKNYLFSTWAFRILWLQYATWDYYYSYKKATPDWCADVLVLDRYYFDFIVDQSLNLRESVFDFEKRVENGCLKRFIQPDLFILIDISPETGWNRKRDGTSMAHLMKLDKAYKSIKSRKDVHIIDGAQTEVQIHHAIRNLVTDFLEEKNEL